MFVCVCMCVCMKEKGRVFCNKLKEEQTKKSEMNCSHRMLTKCPLLHPPLFFDELQFLIWHFKKPRFNSFQRLMRATGPLTLNML